jgi:hypothetical protein
MHHSFDIKYAEKYGVYESIMINNFQYWIIKNKANGKHNYDGRTWTYNSVKALEEIFPYWKSGQIRRCIDSLVEQGVLIKGDYNKNRYERPTWYAFFDESFFLNPKHDLPKTENRTTEIGNSITDVNTDINTNTIIPPISPNGGMKNFEFNNDPTETRKRFVPPTIEEVAEYIKSKHPLATNDKVLAFAEKFWSHYENKSWSYNGNKKMKSWHLAMPQWKETIEKTLYQNNNGYKAPASPPKKNKVEYYNTRWPDRIYICTEEQFQQICEGNPEESYVIKRKYSA